MKNHDKYPWHRKGFSKGILNAKDLDTVSKSGDLSYHDAENLVISKGSPGRLEVIGGESILYDMLNNSDTGDIGVNDGKYYSDRLFFNSNWDCSGSIVTQVNGVEKIVEFWNWVSYKTNPQPGDPESLDSFIRVDGVIVAQNPYIKFGSRLSVDENGGGVVFCTDGVDSPMFFNVSDLIDRIGTDYYYNGFSRSFNTVISQSIGNFPIFISLVDENSDADYVFNGESGLKNGKYMYSVRYGTSLGEYSQWSHSTPLIPVVQKAKNLSNKYLDVGTYGGDPGIESPLGINLLYRINNQSSYEFIQIKRTEYEGGLQSGYTPQASVIIGHIPVYIGQIEIVSIIDYGGDEGSVGVVEDTNSIASISTAETIKYYNNRLWLFNVTTPEVSIDGSIVKTFIDGSYIKPIVKCVGRDGFSNIKNHVYNASYMSGEKYGMAVVCFDDSFANSFAIQISEDGGFKFPERREQMPDENANLSLFLNEIPEAATMLGLVDKCYEKHDNIEDVSSDGELSIELPAKIIHPKNIYDESVNFGKTTLGAYRDIAVEEFDPKGYGSRMFSMGFAINGVDIDLLKSKFPTVSSFGVVRTDPARRVVAQGLGVFDFQHETFNTTGVNKRYKNRIIFYSSDMSTDRGISQSNLVEYIKTHCKIQLVSAVGYFPDVFNCQRLENWGTDESVIDLILNATIIKDANGDINLNDWNMGIPDLTNSGKYGYVGFGRYRNNDGMCSGSSGDFNFKENNIEGNISGSKGIIDIVDIRHCSEVVGKESWVGRGEWWEIELAENIFFTDEMLSSGSVYAGYSNAGAKAIHEPVYIVNIINELAAIGSSELTPFYNTGCFVKIESQMHKVAPDESNKGVDNLTVQLVDERWEDCFSYSLGTNSPMVGILYERTVDDAIKVWIDETYMDKSNVALVKNKIKQFGHYNTSLFGGEYNVFGFYKHRVVDDVYYVDFNSVDVDGLFFKPDSFSIILCRYNSDRPIRVFGGDTFINYSMFAAMDMKSDYQENHPKLLEVTRVPLMYSAYRFKTELLWDNVNNYPYDDYVGWARWLRQLVYRFISENRMNVALDYEYDDGVSYSNQRVYPKINYIIRPTPMLTDGNLDTEWTNASDDYKVAFPEENELWRYGGIRFSPLSNFDYTHKDTSLVYTVSPETTDVIRVAPNRMMFSLKSIPGVSVGYRSFIPSNYYDLNHDGGGIIGAAQSEDGSGGNLHVFTNKGVAIIIVDKRLISSLQGDPDNLILSDESTIVTGEYWLTKNIGVSLLFKKTISSIGFGVVFCNDIGVFLISDGKIIRMSDTYYDEIYKKISNQNNTFNSVFDIKNGRYYLLTNGDDGVLNFIFDTDIKNWIGKSTNGFSSISSLKNGLVGMHILSDPGFVKTYLIDDKSSNMIGGQIIQTRLVSNFIPRTEYPASKIIEVDDVKEFRKLRIKSEAFPQTVKFYNGIENFDGGNSFSQIYGSDFENFVNFESWIKGGKANVGTSIVIEVISSIIPIGWIDFISVQFKKK